MLSRPIAISLSPNTESDDVVLALKTIGNPWLWYEGSAQNSIIDWFSRYFDTSQVLFYNSGRSAELEILKAFGIGAGDEVIIQAFTCVAVPNSVIWSGATPVYADVDTSLNLSVETIQRCFSTKTKAIIVQHTFGVPAEIDLIVEWAKKNNCLVIEDCSHSLGGTYKNKLLGTWGDASFFSFGRDKVVSSVFGGAAVIAANHAKAFAELTRQHKSLRYPGRLWILQQLFHPVAFALILPFYLVGIGKVLLFLLQRLHMLSFPVYPEEKYGKNPGVFPAKYPNALAILLMQQLNKLARYNDTRKQAVQVYKQILSTNKTVRYAQDREGAMYLRLSLFVRNPDKCIQTLKKQGVLIGNWYRTAVDPKGTQYASIGYVDGSCPVAEEACSTIINLPTLIRPEYARKIANMIQSIL